MSRNLSIPPVGRCHAGLLFLLVLLVSFCRAAEPVEETTGGDTPRDELHAGDIDIHASRVYAFVDKTGLGHQHAVVGRLKSGTLKVESKQAGRMEFDMASFIADSTAARRYLQLPGQTDGTTQNQVTQNMLSNAVLDVAQFPTATFEVESAHRIREASKNVKAQYELVGNFTLHGVSQKLRLKAEGSEERAGYLHLVGHFAINQTAFGITPYTKAFGAVGVADGVRIYGDLWIVTDPAAARTTKEKTRASR